MASTEVTTRIGLPDGVHSFDEPAILDRDCHRRLLDGNAVPTKSDGAGERVVLEIDEIVRQTAVESPIVSIVRKSLGLPRHQLRHRIGLAQTRDVRAAQGSLNRHREWNEQGPRMFEDMPRGANVRLDVKVHVVSPLWKASARRCDVASHQDKICLAEKPWIGLIEQT